MVKNIRGLMGAIIGASVIAAMFVAFPALAQEVATIPAPDGLPAWLAPFWGAIVPLAITGLTSLLSAFLPQGQPGTVWGAVRAILDALAANWLNAKNAKK